MAKKTKQPKSVETLKHGEATRKNIPTAEYQSVMQKGEQAPIQVAYERRNKDLDPQLVWRGKDMQDWSDLVVNAPPLYIQEKVHPKVLIDDLRKQSESGKEQETGGMADMFSDFNGLPDEDAKTEFYQHDAHWSNRMILGDSLQVMASLAEREGLKGKVQCIYFDPPYGIKFNSNFQWSTTNRDVKDGKAEHITREPEQVKAFRDTWKDGIHSYLTYLRDRLMVARDLLTDSGSIFIQIGDENVHRVRALLDEVFGEAQFCAAIACQKTTSANSPSGKTNVLPGVYDTILWYARNADSVKYRVQYNKKIAGLAGATGYKNVELPNGYRESLKKGSNLSDFPDGSRLFAKGDTRSATGVDKTRYTVSLNGKSFKPHPGVWKTSEVGMSRLIKANRITPNNKNLYYIRYLNDFPAYPITNVWTDVQSSFMSERMYVVQTSTSVVQRCLLMTTDPGDIVLDPTCGSGTTATVSEQWGRRWITIDTSRVSLALARARLMGSRYLYYMLADSRDGQIKESQLSHTPISSKVVRGDIRQGFVNERVPHITLKSIANNLEIDVIWKQYEEKMDPLREQLSKEVNTTWGEWEIPRDVETDWSDDAKELHSKWWDQRILRQREIDESIAAKAEFETLYDKPYEDNKVVRVAGPFTVESLSPHRMLAMDENDELVGVEDDKGGYGEGHDFVQLILDNLETAGVQQVHKEDKIDFSTIKPWPGDFVCAEGRYMEGEEEKRAAIFVGPEFGTVSRVDLVAAAREAGDADYDVLIACAFNYEAHTTEFEKLGRLPVLKARMNADLHMAEDLKNTGKGNLFVIFGEPDIDITEVAGGQFTVKVNGVDVFDPTSGEVRSDGADGIACWFIDTDYNEESFFVRHAYFLGANDPYKALKTTLKAEINQEAWESLSSDVSRPFDKPQSGRIAVKVINHLGDEVMKVFSV